MAGLITGYLSALSRGWRGFQEAGYLVARAEVVQPTQTSIAWYWGAVGQGEWGGASLPPDFSTGSGGLEVEAAPVPTPGSPHLFLQRLSGPGTPPALGLGR